MKIVLLTRRSVADSLSLSLLFHIHEDPGSNLGTTVRYHYSYITINSHYC